MTSSSQLTLDYKTRAEQRGHKETVKSLKSKAKKKPNNNNNKNYMQYVKIIMKCIHKHTHTISHVNKLKKI